MAKFSTTFNIPGSQATLDFVDVELNTDTPLYLDPYAIQIKRDDWSIKCGDHIRSFFNELLDALRANNLRRATHLLQNLHEPNETRFGVSKGTPNGRAIGREKAQSFAEAIRRSRAFLTGNLSDMSEAELFVKFIGPDTISDMVTNVLRGLLAKYTLDQCNIYAVPTQPVATLGPVWNSENLDWESNILDLPIHDNKPILLVPKYSVRRSLSLNSQEFWNHHMTEFLQQEYLQAGGALVQTFKNGKQKVFKKDVQAIHPKVKNGLADFVSQHPEVLATYKRLKGAEGPLSNDELSLIMDDRYFDETIFASSLIQRLGDIQTGNASATTYHNISMGICTFLFYPRLSVPIKEAEIHEGRKRIDFKFNNAATIGFFHTMLQNPNTRSIDIPFECKNYSKEIANPELDQLAGRFSLHRGKLGFLLCREMDNKARFIQRCRDTVRDDRGYIIVFDDEDLIHMLTLVANGRRESIDRFLQSRFTQITE